MAVALATLVLVALACALVPSPATSSSSTGGKVVVLVVDRIGPRDITPATAPFLSGLADRWSAGMMLARTAERENGKEPDLGAEYVTLGAGVRAKGSRSASLSFDPGEVFAGGSGATTAGRYFEESSAAAVPAGGVACLGVPEIKLNNKSIGTDKNVGLLASELAAEGKRPAVVGNDDSFLRPVRLAPLLVCGPTGVVPLGHVAGLTTAAPGQPGGVITDMAALAAESRRLLAGCDVLVIDTGDTGRVDREGGSMGNAALDAARGRAMRRVDRFAAGFVPSLDLKSCLVLVVSPGAPVRARLDGDYATPFIAAGKGFSTGLLKSGSTRRPGFVSSTDFLPTVLDFFGRGAPSTVTGSAMETAGKAPGGATSLGYIGKLDRQYIATRTARWPVVLGYLVCVWIFLILALACIPAASRKLGLERRRDGLVRLLKPVAVVLLAMPVSFLAVSAFTFGSWAFPLIFCVAYALVVGLGAYFIARRNVRIDPVTLVCLFSSAVMLVDLLFGGRLLMIPLLGSSAQDGMRFFGLSNAVTGMLIGYSIWGLAGLGGDVAGKRGPARWGILLGLAVVTFAIGFGGLGGDFGGFVSMAVVTLVFFFATTKGGFRSWRVPAIVVVTLVATAVILGADALFVHTHAGHALAAGSGQLLPMIGRKTLVLLAQIKSVLFLALVMIAGVVAMALWMRRPGSLWSRRWEFDGPWTAALFSILIGSIVALLLNDTGIGMMGTMVMITVPVAFYHFASQAPPG
ncbi:MAG: hypothetical protein ACYC99_03310 [Candidatus Geothermincolia bacterium]